MKKKWTWIIILCIFNFSLIGFILTHPAPNSKEATTVVKNVSTKKQEDKKSFTFVGVGDNLYHEAMYWYQNYRNGYYDFDSYYEMTNKYTQNADLAYINFETLCIGESYGLSGYPTFNGPTEILSSVNKAGFDWWSLSSNHSLDRGADGLLAQIDLIHNEYPNVITTGSHISQEDKNRTLVKEINGIKVGFLGYTYGLNGFSLPEDKPWLIDLIDKDQIKQDMEALNKVSDVQMVSMHWGNEYQTEPTQEQEDLANYLNELGVEVVIGSHPHVIEPAKIIKGKNQNTLVYYSLGNYTSAQDMDITMVGGMASFTLNYDPDTKTTSFTDTKFIPLITWFDTGFNDWKTYMIDDYNDSIASTHRLSSEYDLSKEWVQQFVQSVMQNPDGIEVVLE